jgi:hypothetical protein
MTPSERRELIELWLLANDGAADDAQFARLNARVESDGAARSLLLELTRHQGWLAWNAGQTRLPAALEALRGAESPADQLEQPANPPLRTLTESPAPGPRAAATPSHGASAGGGASLPTMPSAPAWIVPAIAAALVVAFFGGWRLAQHRDPQFDSTLVRATVVSSTGCVWEPGNSASLSRGGLAGGDSLRLLEGIAELRIRHGLGGASLQLEGPVSVVLTADGAPSLSYGKIVVQTDAIDAQDFTIETPFGSVFADCNAEIGVMAFGSTAELHCFRGGVVVQSPWFVSAGEEIASKRIGAGQSLLFHNVGGMALSVAAGTANRTRFTPQVSMQADFLAVGSDYVDEIQRARPVAYWRFEEHDHADKSPVVRNWMGDSFTGRLKGKVRWIGPSGNQCIEFGVAPEPGSLIVDQSWDEVLDGDFSLEAWIKPSHYHLGSVMGFIGEFDWKDRRNKHGVLLEVNGTSQPGSTHRPERIRFLHRSVLGVQGGVSCFSDGAYHTRRWQHVAAVKQGDQLRLYLDGQLVSHAQDPAPTPLGLQLVMGQLYTETVERFFIGQVDEVAVYDRSLEEREIRQHYESLRPALRPAATTPL